MKKAFLVLVLAFGAVGLFAPRSEATFPVIEIGGNLIQNISTALQTYEQLKIVEQNLERYQALLESLTDSHFGIREAFELGEAFAYLDPGVIEKLSEWYPVSDEDFILIHEIPYNDLRQIRSRQLIDSYRGIMAAAGGMASRELSILDVFERAAESLNITEGTNGILVAQGEIAHHNGAKLQDIDVSLKGLLSMGSLYLQSQAAERLEGTDLTVQWLEGTLIPHDEEVPDWTEPQIGFTPSGPVSL